MQTFQPTYTKAGRIELSQKWYARFAFNGRNVRLPLFNDKELSEAFAAKLDRLLAFKEAGMPNDAETVRWLGQIGTVMAKRMQGHGLLKPEECFAGQSVADLLARCGRRNDLMLRWLDFFRLGDLSAAVVEKKIAAMWTVQERNAVRRPLKAFGAWLADNEYVQANPFASLKLERDLNKVKRTRRALTDEEARKLLSLDNDMTIIYRLALETGLRANEIRTLALDDFVQENNTLVNGPPAYSIHLRGGNAKNGKHAIVPLSVDLGAHIWSGIPYGNVKMLFPQFPRRQCEVLQGHLREAGIDPVINGAVVDFHSLRKTFITNLRRAGVHPGVMQALARHSDIKLTLQTYNEVTDEDKRKAVERLPVLV